MKIVSGHTGNIFTKRGEGQLEHGHAELIQVKCHIVVLYISVIWVAKYIDDHHRNPNNNDKDHLVGQLTRLNVTASSLTCKLKNNVTSLWDAFSLS